MRYRAALAGMLAGALLIGPAHAIEQGGVSDATTAATITTVSGNCLAADGYRRGLVFDASASAANIGYCEITPGGTSCTAAIGTTGTTTITAGSPPFWWPAGAAPQNGFCFIAASGSQPFTIRQGY